jgi:hypothetical protein
MCPVIIALISSSDMNESPPKPISRRVPVDAAILLSDDMDDFTIRPAVDVDIAQILEMVQSSRPLPIP